MEDIFSIQPSNAHQSLLLLDPAEWQGLSVRINRESLAAAWKPMAFNFKASDAKTAQLPTICTVYVPGVLAFRSDLQEQLVMSVSASCFPCREPADFSNSTPPLTSYSPLFWH
jgi:hypothetical protein